MAGRGGGGGGGRIRNHETTENIANKRPPDF